MEKTMRVIISVLTGAAALGLVPGLGAQQKAPKKEAAPMTKTAPERDGCFKTDDRTECVFRRGGLDSMMQKRPAIGVQLSPTGTLRDTLGVFVSRVTPKGPAENAGIVEGDRIVSINGVDLRVNSADAEDSYASELPTRRLTREVGKLSPGNVATLRVFSGGRVRDVAVTVGRASDLRERGQFGMLDGMPGLMRTMGTMPNFDGMRMQLRSMPRMRMEDMELPRMKLEELRNHMRLEGMEPFRNGQRLKIAGPSRVRILRDGDAWTIGPDDDVIVKKLEKTKADKEKVEKAKSEKKKNQ
jgi:hypothetical protein